MNKRTTAKIIRHAIKLMEKGWCQQAWATTASGSLCNSESDLATSFCASGALSRAVRDTPGCDNKRSLDARVVVERSVPKRNFGGKKVSQALLTFNDRKDTKKTDVLKVFKRALKSLS